MPERFLEENRFLFLETGLGANELLLESFTGTEGISQLFSFQLELLSENPRIKFEGLLGQEVSFGVAGMDGQETLPNGLPARLLQPCIMRASTVLPVPLSPLSKIAASAAATFCSASPLVGNPP